MVANALLAAGLQCVVVEIEAGSRDVSQIPFDDTLVLRGWRNDACLKDRALSIETVAVIKDAAGRLGARVADGGTRLGWHKRPRYRE